MNNPSTMIKSITEKLEFLNSMEELYLKVQEMLHYLGIKSPSKPDFNYYSELINCLLYTSPSPRDGLLSRMPSSA